MNFFKQYTVTLVYWYMFTSEHDGNKINIWYCEYFFFLFLNSLSIFMVELDMIEILCWWP